MDDQSQGLVPQRARALILDKQGAEEVEAVTAEFFERAQELAAEAEARAGETGEPLQRVGIGAFLRIDRLDQN